MSKIRAIFADGASGVTIRTELTSMLPFSVTATLTAALAGTPVHIVPVASVPSGMKVYVTDILLKVNGGTVWTDATGVGVNIQDTSAVPVIGASVAKANLTGNAKIGKESVSCVLGDSIALGFGFTVNKGLDLAADKNFTAGSDIVVTVTGYIAA